MWCDNGTGGDHGASEVCAEFKLAAVRLIRDRGASYAQASTDLGLHVSQLRHWGKKFAEDPQHSFPGHGQMKPEQLFSRRVVGWSMSAAMTA